MNTLHQQLWIVFFALCCFMLPILYHQREQEHRQPLAHETQNPDVCFNLLLRMFGKEVLSYLVRMTVSVGYGIIGALFGRADERMIISLMIGVLIGTVIERILHYQK